jgi:hypothetical protein
MMHLVIYRILKYTLKQVFFFFFFLSKFYKKNKKKIKKLTYGTKKVEGVSFPIHGGKNVDKGKRIGM